MHTKYTYTIDKSGWGEGPWRDEPDRVEWSHGFPCLIIRNEKTSGSLNGYVAVPPGHPWHKQHYDNVDAMVHGGLSFGGEWSPPEWDWVPTAAEKEAAGFVAAVRESPTDATARGAYADWLRDRGRDGDADLLVSVPSWWWLGFDCAHAGDLCPAMSFLFTDPYGDVYRDVVYVTAETNSLAEQAINAARKPRPGA